MHRRPITFFAERLRLDGDLYLPSGKGPFPVVVPCSGYTGLKVLHPERFARALVPRGFAVLAFDYRGFGASEGERGRLVPQDQVQDVRAAVSFLETMPEIDSERIGLLGWALGGGVAIAEAADDGRVAAVAAINAIGNGSRSVEAMHGKESWEGLLAWIEEDRRRRACSGVSRLIDPFDVVRLDRVTGGYVSEELYKAPGYGASVSVESVERLLCFDPEAQVARIAPRPLLLVHGADNQLHLPEESQALYEAAREPKQLELLPASGHTEWMFDDHATFLRLVELLACFFAESFLEYPAAMAM